jgi:UDP-N-acetylglucosamine:LPS N-acetylglucosamine transferase
MVDAILKTLADKPHVQPVVAEWVMSGADVASWAGVRTLKAFPLARYYNAFDFTISAAGYNSFNEIVAFGVPAILVAHEQPVVDDQLARAAFAEENGAALRLSESDIHGIAPLIDIVLDERIRWLLKSNCTRLAQGNGASDAAQAIVDLLH